MFQSKYFFVLSLSQDHRFHHLVLQLIVNTMAVYYVLSELHTSLEFRAVLLLDWLPTMAKEPSLYCYLREEKRWIHTFLYGICPKVNAPNSARIWTQLTNFSFQSAITLTANISIIQSYFNHWKMLFLINRSNQENMFNRVKIQSIMIIIIRIISKFHNYYYLVILGLVTNEFTETF